MVAIVGVRNDFYEKGLHSSKGSDLKRNLEICSKYIADCRLKNSKRNHILANDSSGKIHKSQLEILYEEKRK